MNKKQLQFISKLTITILFMGLWYWLTYQLGILLNTPTWLMFCVMIYLTLIYVKIMIDFITKEFNAKE